MSGSSELKLHLYLRAWGGGGGGGAWCMLTHLYLSSRYFSTQCRCRSQPQQGSPQWKVDEMTATPSFHGAIYKRESERRLRECDSNAFLTRFSKTSQQYKLSVMTKSGRKIKFKHLGIIITVDSYCLEGTSGVKHPSISTLLEFHQNNPINSDIASIGNGVECSPQDFFTVPM